MREAFREEIEETFYVGSDEELEDSLLLSVSPFSDDEEEEADKPDFVITGRVSTSAREIAGNKIHAQSSINPDDNGIETQSINALLPSRR